MKKQVSWVALIFVVSLVICSNVFANDKCTGEWELGRAIQVAPTHSTNPDWPDWKAKLGVCNTGQITFVQQAYFNSFPTHQELSNAFGRRVHGSVWYEVPEKERSFYVFESDWRIWQKKQESIVGSQIAVRLLLMKTNNNTTVYTPENPNPNSANESNITLTEKSWQNVYPVGATYCQIQLRSDNTFKVKFGVVRNGYVEIFNLRRDIPVPQAWHRGLEPFNLTLEFPEYEFGTGFEPNDSSDVWSARVYIPGYNL